MTTTKQQERNLILNHNLRNYLKKQWLSYKHMMNLVLKHGNQFVKFQEIILVKYMKDLILDLNNSEKVITIHLFQQC